MQTIEEEDQYSFQARLAAWDGRGEAEPEYDWGESVGEERWEV